MKNKITMKTFFSLLVVLLGNPSFLFSHSETDVKNMVASNQYIFVAQYALPMSGRTRNLTSEYDLTVSKDSVIAYLPYFGRTYQAPMDPSQGGIKFTSVKFDYKTSKTKKGSWDISIATKDLSDNNRLSLHISTNGTATLQVMSTFKQPITFTGYIKENPKPKKAF
ncbi:MAG: DUF4251 domain-containing protein [Ginsengibacter sp.]